MQTFATVTAVVPTTPGQFDATVDPDWTIDGRPNGGYLLAILGRAATACVAQEHVIAASAHYVRAPAPGPVTIVTEVLRAGRSASQVRARMAQDGATCVEALFVVATLDPAAQPYWDAGVPDTATAPRERCVRVPGRTPTGMSAAIMDQVDLRIDPACLGFATGRPSGRGELRGWLSLPDDEAPDPVSLLYAVDAFPPATFEIEATGWVPTLELTAYVRALPAPGPVRVMHRARLVEAQRVDEACWVWDVRGRLVAQATQLAGVRLG